MGLFKSWGRQCPPVVGLGRTAARGESDPGVASTTQPKAALGTERKPCRLFGLVMDGGMKNCRIILSALLLCLGLVARVAVAGIAVSNEVITSDMPATGYFRQPSISGDGRYVTFVYADVGKGEAVFVHDRATGTNRQVTLSPTGEPPNNASINPIISTDGRYIAFGSAASNLADGKPGIFVYDQVTQALERIGNGGAWGSGQLLPTAISSDGRYVTFYGESFYGEGTFAYCCMKIFVYDRIAKTTEVLAPSISAVTTASTSGPHISDDGRYVAYSDHNVFVYDRVTGANEMVNVDSAGQVGNGMSSDWGSWESPSMSSDGRFVLFRSDSTNLVANDPNPNGGDLYVRDRSAGTTERISSYASGGFANLSADGRYVVYAIKGRLLVHDRVTGIEQTIPDYYQVSHYQLPLFPPSISAHGRYVAYETKSSAYANPFQIAVADLGSPAAVTLSATALTLAEGGAAATYTISLAAAPAANVVVTVSPGTQLAASPTPLTFTPTNWNVPQTVTVQAIQDGIAEGSHTGTLTHTAASADPDYNGIAIGSVSVAISEAVIPVVKLSVPSGTVWTQSALPVQGTAAPGATVTLYALNTTTGAVSVVSAVADANGNWSMVLTGLADGTYELQAEADGIKGTKVNIVVDSHAPVSTLSVTSINGPSAGGWYTGPVNLAITAADGVGGQGAARNEYMLDGGIWIAFPASGVTINLDGNHSVCYRSIDNANNIEVARCVQVPVDVAAPQVNAVFNAVTNTLNLNAQDAVSGIVSVEVSLDSGQSWMTQTGPLSFTKDGTYTVQYRVRDNAGNLASGQSTVKAVTKPSITVAGIAVSTEIITSDMPATGSSLEPSISGDGRYVAFLYKINTDKADVFVHDRATGTNRQVTLSPSGESGNNASYYPRISKDGRYVVFYSNATNLVASGQSGVFVYDQTTQTLEYIGSNGNSAYGLGISSDGRYVAYVNLIVAPGGNIAGTATFLWDRVTQTTQKLNDMILAEGRIGISDDGRYFSYVAPRAVSGSGAGTRDVFVYDRVTGTSEMVNVNSAGQGGDGSGTSVGEVPLISSDGRFVAFSSTSTNLVANDTNNAWDIFVHDRNTHTTERASVSSAGIQSASGASSYRPDLSANGRYVAFRGDDGNLDLSGNKQAGLFVRDRVNGTTRNIASGQVNWPSISTDGRYVAYEYYSDASPQIAVADLGVPTVGITLSTSALALTEGGAAATYTISLAAAPAANVVVTVSPGTQLAASPTQLTFTPANWNVPQTVTVQAIQDGIAEGSHTGTLTHTATSADPDYNGIAIGSIGVVITEAPVIPVATIPVTDGVAWTRSDLPVTGTAAPGATVTVSATNLTTGTVSAVSAVADANGAWSLTLTGLASGNYSLQPDAGGVKGGTLSFALALSGGSGGSGSLPLILTGASVYTINDAWTSLGNGFDTTGGNGAYNLYFLNEAGSFLNSGNGAAASLNQDISTPGTYTFFYRADASGYNWPTRFAGLNLFFNGSATPGISAVAGFNFANPSPMAFGNPSFGLVNADVVPGANVLSFMVGDLRATLTVFSLMDYLNPAVPPALPDLVSPTNNVPSGLNDYSGIITLQVARESASSGGLSPVLLLPGSGVWTQANLPLHGTASAGTTVTLHVKNLHTNATGTYTAVAAADGTWSILVPGLEDCHYQLQAEVNGLFGNQEVIYLDSHAPTTALSVGLAGGGGGGVGTGTGGWYSGAISIGLSALDNTFGHGVGVDRIEYSLNAGAWTVFPGTGLTLDRDGIYSFCYRAVDNAGNVESVRCVPLWIDMTAPVVTPRFDGTRNVLNLGAMDGVSGIGSLEVSLDGGASWSNSTGSVSFPQGGTYTVSYRCRDNAGNVATGQTTVTVITPWVPPNPPYQSNGGFITGGGQVNLAAGSAQFDFVVKYQKGDAVPKGNAQLQLTSGKFDFRSSSFDWLVTTPSQAWFAGSGTLNGTGDYGYLMSVIDIGSGSKSVDALRLKVWNKVNGAVVYDTQPGAADMAEPTLLLSKGNITIHK